MSAAPQGFRLTEVKRAYRALRDAGMNITRVVFEGSKFEFITADGDAGSKVDVEDIKKLV